MDYEAARLADTAVSTTIRSTNGVPIIARGKSFIQAIGDVGRLAAAP